MSTSLTFHDDGRGRRERPHELALPGDERLEEHDSLFIVGPGVHFAVRVPAFLSQFLPAFGLGQEFTDSALR